MTNLKQRIPLGKDHYWGLVELLDEPLIKHEVQMKMTNFERKPFDENPYWNFLQECSSEDTMGNFNDKQGYFLLISCVLIILN